MGTETYLRVGIDGTASVSGERVVKRSLDNISNAAAATSQSLEKVKRGCGSMGDKAPEAEKVVKRSLDNISKHAEMAGVSIYTLENMFVRLAARTAMIAGIYGTIGAIKSTVKESLQYLGQIETSGLGIAASFLTNGKYVEILTGKTLEGHRALKTAQMDSADVIKQLQIANMKTAATLDQLIYAYQVTLPEAQNKAFNRKQIMEYTLAMVQAAGAIGLPYAQIAEETRDMLKGAVNSRNTRIATILGMGPQNEEYMAAVKKGGDELFNYLMKRLEGFKLAGIETQKTWEGLWSNIKDIAKQGGGIAFQGLFTGIKEELTRLQNYLVTIDEATGKIKWNPDFIKGAQDIGKTVNSLFNGFMSGIQWVIEWNQGIKLAGEMLLGYYVSLKAATAVQKIANLLSLESLTIENSRKIAATEQLAINAQQAQAALAQARANQVLLGSNIAIMEADAASTSQKMAQIALDRETIASKIAVQQASVASAAMKKEEALANIATLSSQLEHERSVKRLLTTGPDVVALERQLLINKNNLRSANSQLASSQNKLTQTQTEYAAATELHNVAQRQSVEMSQRVNAAKKQISVVTKEVQVAEEAAAVATHAHNAAIDRATFSSKAYAGATSLLKSVINALGGPIGAITMLLGLGATAWMIWGKEAKDANSPELENSIESITAALRKQNKELAERERQEKGTSKGGLMSGHEFPGASDKELAALRDKRWELIKIEAELKRLGVSSVDTSGPISTLGISAGKSSDYIKSLSMQAGQARIKIKELEDELKKRGTHQSNYVQNTPIPKVDKLAAEIAGLQKQLLDAWLAYDKAFTDRVINQYKNNTRLQLDALEQQHNLQLMSEESFINRKAALQEKAANMELAALSKRKQNVLNELQKLGINEKQAFEYIDKPNFEPGSNKNTNKIVLLELKSMLELRTKLQDILKEENNLKTSGEQADITRTYALLQNLRNIQKTYVDTTSAIKDMQGATVEATILRERQIKLELESRKFAIIEGGSGDTPAGKAEVLNISKLIEASDLRITKVKYEQLKVQTEIKAQMLDQLGLSGEASELRNSIVPMDPARLGLDATTKALQDMADALKEIVGNFEQLHRNDSIKFEIEDVKTDPWTKRERDIRREYLRTKEYKEGLLKEYMKDEKGNAKLIQGVQEDLHLNERKRAAQTLQLKTDMDQMYVQTAAQLMGDLSASMDTSNRAQFEASKALNIGQAIMNTAAAIMQAMAALPPPASYVAAGVAAATGALQVAKIASTSYGGGGSVGATGLSGSGYGSSAGGTSSGVGSKIGNTINGVGDMQTQEMLSRVATSIENASLSLVKVADGLTDITVLFKDNGPGANLGTMLSGRGYKEKTAAAEGWDKMYYGAPLGFVAGAVGSVISSITGGSWQKSGAGLRLGGEGGDLEVLQYLNMVKKGGWFKSDKSKTILGEANPEIKEALSGMYSNIVSTIFKGAAVLGTTVDTESIQLKNTKIKTSGRTPEQINKDLEKFLLSAADTSAQATVGLKEFTKYGESAFDALVRLSSALQNVNHMLDLVGMNVLNSSMASGDLADRLQNALGGTEAFTNKVNDYFTSMFSEYEQNEMKGNSYRRELQTGINSINSTFEDLNWTVPTTREEFRSLVGSLDLTTDMGASLFVTLMDLVPAMDGFLESLENMQDVLREYKGWDIRNLSATGVSEFAEVMSLLLSQEEELANARRRGLDTTLLETTQRNELVKYIKDNFTKYSEDYKNIQDELNQYVIEGATNLLNSAKTLASEWLNITNSLKKARESLMIGGSSALSPEAQLAFAKTTAMDAFTKGKAGDKDAMASFGGYATSYLDLAKKYYGATTTFASEFNMFSDLLNSSVEFSQTQVNYQEANAQAQQAILNTLEKSEDQRRKDAEAALEAQKAQIKILMDGFKLLLDRATTSETSLAELENLLRKLVIGV